MAGAKGEGRVDWAGAMAKLPKGDRSPFTNITFTLTHEQAARVRAALAAAKEAGDFGPTGNANSNGNALARIVDAYA